MYLNLRTSNDDDHHNNDDGIGSGDDQSQTSSPITTPTTPFVTTHNNNNNNNKDTKKMSMMTMMAKSMMTAKSMKKNLNQIDIEMNNNNEHFMLNKLSNVVHRMIKLITYLSLVIFLVTTIMCVSIYSLSHSLIMMKQLIHGNDESSTTSMSIAAAEKQLLEAQLQQQSLEHGLSPYLLDNDDDNDLDDSDGSGSGSSSGKQRRHVISLPSLDPETIRQMISKVRTNTQTMLEQQQQQQEQYKKREPHPQNQPQWHQKLGGSGKQRLKYYFNLPPFLQQPYDLSLNESDRLIDEYKFLLHNPARYVFNFKIYPTPEYYSLVNYSLARVKLYFNNALLDKREIKRQINDGVRKNALTWNKSVRLDQIYAIKDTDFNPDSPILPFYTKEERERLSPEGTWLNARANSVFVFALTSLNYTDNTIDGHRVFLPLSTIFFSPSNDLTVEQLYNIKFEIVMKKPRNGGAAGGSGNRSGKGENYSYANVVNVDENIGDNSGGEANNVNNKK